MFVADTDLRNRAATVTDLRNRAATVTDLRNRAVTVQIVTSWGCWKSDQESPLSSDSWCLLLTAIFCYCQRMGVEWAHPALRSRYVPSEYCKGREHVRNTFNEGRLRLPTQSAMPACSPPR